MLPTAAHLPQLDLIRYRGDSADLTIPLTNPDTGAAFPPSGHNLLWTLKAKASDLDSAALVQKISTVGGITLANPSVVSLVPADFALLLADVCYEWDVQAQNLTTGAVRTVARGTLAFAFDVSKTTALAIPTTTTNPSAGFSSAWGAITGTLSAQTDLQTALNLRLNLTGGTLTGPLMLSTSVTGAAAGALYRIADTLRYRDGTNTERLLLNSVDNLANLANPTTARTNLGLGTLATQSGTFSGTFSGTASGTNTGDQTISLTGEVTGSGSGSFAATVANSAVIGKVLTGYASAAGTVAAADSILAAIQKLNGNDATNANLTGGVTSVGNAATVVTNANLTGEVTSVGNAATVTNTAVIGKILTGYASAAGTVAAADSILAAIQKLNGNDATNANLTGGVTSVGNAATVVTNANLTGEVTSVGNAATVANSAVIAKVLTGYASGAGTVAAADSILAAIQKLNGNDATNANLTGPITSVGNATAIAAQTGTGTTFVMSASPTLVTPNIGVATGTSLALTTGTVSSAPTAANDLANKAYVDSVAAGLDVKGSVVVATSSDTTLSGTTTIDGIAVIAGDRVLVRAQTLAQNNGIYIVAAGSWSRALDADAWAEIPGAFCFVETGSTFSDTGWVCTSNLGGTLGTTAITFSQFSGAGTYLPGVGLTLTGSTFAIDATVATLAGVQALTNKSIGATQLTGTIAAARFPASTGDATAAIGTTAFTVVALNGVALSGLATGILRNTTGSGAPVIAVAADFPTLNQSTTGTAAGLSATLVAASGGTGNASYAIGDLLQASATTTLARLASIATGNVLLSGGVTTVSSWGKVGLTTHVAGILPVANGGTNNAFFTISGPTTSAKTYTVPDANATLLTDAAAVTVAQGGSGRATATTAFALLAAGTTATGAHQTLATGATTEILVGAGGSALPVWTTATGTGAPVRAGSPTFTGTVAAAALTATGAITPSQTAGIVGTTTNNNANAGSVGEYVAATVTQASAITLTTGTAVNITSISLGAGDWDVNVAGYFLAGATTTLNNLIVSISQTSGVLDTAEGAFQRTSYNALAIGNAITGLAVPPWRVSLTVTTTIFFVASTSFATSTLSGYGKISARRVR